MKNDFVEPITTEQEDVHTPREASTRPDRAKKAVYTIIKRDGQERGFWLRIGAAFVNRDQSLNVYLDALPTNRQLHIRDLSN